MNLYSNAPTPNFNYGGKNASQSWSNKIEILTFDKEEFLTLPPCTLFLIFLSHNLARCNRQTNKFQKTKTVLKGSSLSSSFFFSPREFVFVHFLMLTSSFDCPVLVHT